MLVIFVIHLLACFKFASCLQCFTCNQRILGANSCQTNVIEDCSITYPQKTAICLRSVQRSFDGQPPWIFAQCYALGMPTDPLLNQCETKEVRGRSNTLLYTIEICTCTTELCNGSPSIVIPPPIPGIPQPPLFPVVPQPGFAVTSSLQCYKCNQRFQNTVTCRNPMIESCEQALPGQAAVCAKRVQTFANGDPPWVFAQCEPRMGAMAAAASPTGVVPLTADSCNVVNGRYENGRYDSIETCICSSSICNNYVTPPGGTIGPSIGVVNFPPVIGGAANKLSCYRCSERLTNRTSCATRSVEDCNLSYPGQPVACVRSVQTFSDGQYPWVVERCQIRALFPESRPNDCWSQPLTGGASITGQNGTDYLEFCTCIGDFCNTEAIMSTRLNETIITTTSAQG